MNDQLTFGDIISNITEALTEADGEYIATIHNAICSRRIAYTEDSMWEYEDGEGE